MNNENSEEQSMKKHLNLTQRVKIESMLDNGASLTEISKDEEIDKNLTTISREVKNHLIVSKKAAHLRRFNNCLIREGCPDIRHCKLWECPNYVKEECDKLNKPPYCCNGCKCLSKCTLEKHFYRADYAQNEYESILTESRSGIQATEEEIAYLNEIFVQPVCEQGQSPHHVYANNPDKIMFSEKTIYKLIDEGYLKVRNIDLLRKVKLRPRAIKKKVYKVDKQCLEGRRYEDYKEYIKDHKDIAIVEMDSVIGCKGGKALLTLHFVNCEFMLAFIRDHNDSQSVIDIFNNLQKTLGLDKFKELFPLILTDNGSEFSNPSALEIDPETGEKRTQIFYCHPSSPNEKGSCENNHEFIRRVIPQGTPFDNLDQNDINKLMSHINSYSRKKMNDKTPYFMFSTLYGDGISELLGIELVEPSKINLTANLLKK